MTSIYIPTNNGSNTTSEDYTLLADKVSIIQSQLIPITSTFSINGDNLDITKNTTIQNLKSPAATIGSVISGTPTVSDDTLRLYGRLQNIHNGYTPIFTDKSINNATVAQFEAPFMVDEGKITMNIGKNSTAMAQFRLIPKAGNTFYFQMSHAGDTNNAIIGYSPQNIDLNKNTSINGTLTTTGNATFSNNVYVGPSGGTAERGIYINGQLGDEKANEVGGMVRRIYQTTTENQNNELLVFNFNDVDGIYGPDRVRLLGANLRFDTYDTTTTSTSYEKQRMIIKQNGDVDIEENLLVKKNFTTTGAIAANGSITIFKASSDTNNNQPRGLYIQGPQGDQDNNCGITRRIYPGGNSESSEILVWNFNDADTTSGPDRVRLLGANVRFDTYSTATNNLDGGTQRMLIKNNGDIDIEENLLVKKNTTITGTLNAGGTTVSSLNCTGNASITGDLTVSGTISGSLNAIIRKTIRTVSTGVAELSNNDTVIYVSGSASIYTNQTALPPVGHEYEIYDYSASVNGFAISTVGGVAGVLKDIDGTDKTNISLPNYKAIKVIHIGSNVWLRAF